MKKFLRKFLLGLVLVSAFSVWYQKGTRDEHTAPARHAARIVVVGDIHGDWKTDIDELALEQLSPDLVLFTGDFGNEDIDMVKDVKALKFPKATILGNHDAWIVGRMRAMGYPADNSPVLKQLEVLGDEHVAYSRLDFNHMKISVVGGRPFALSNGELFNQQDLVSIYGVHDMKESAEKILAAALGAPEGNAIVFLSHNGPFGLGSEKDSPCGSDFRKDGGDNGDHDLAAAIVGAKAAGKKVVFSAFGHMHHMLISGGQRKTLAADREGTYYINAAAVPRVVDGYRHFVVVDLDSNSQVQKVTTEWVDTFLSD